MKFHLMWNSIAMVIAVVILTTKASERVEENQKLATKEQEYNLHMVTVLDTVTAMLILIFAAIWWIFLSNNYSLPLTLLLVELTLWCRFGWSGAKNSRAPTLVRILLCTSFVVAWLTVGIGLVRDIDEMTSEVAELRAIIETNREAYVTSPNVIMQNAEKPLTAEERMAAKTGFEFDRMYYSDELEAYIEAEPQGLGTKYTLVRHDDWLDLDRVVTVFCLTPDWTQYGETGCATKYIYYDFVPYRYSQTKWAMHNNYRYRDKRADDLIPGEPEYYLRRGDAALELDAEMVELVKSALSGDVKWSQTEYGVYMHDGVLNLDEVLGHFGYHYAGRELDVPRGGMTADDIAGYWTVFTDGYNTVKLMADDEKVFWISCDAEGVWEMTDVPMQLFDDEFQTAATLGGKEYTASNRVLGVLIQFLQFKHYGAYDLMAAPVTERYFR